MDISTFAPGAISSVQGKITGFVSKLRCRENTRGGKETAMPPSLRVFFSHSGTVSKNFVVPCLSVRSQVQHGESEYGPRQDAARRLASEMIFSSDAASSASSTMLKNISYSFQWMLKKQMQARVRATSHHILNDTSSREMSAKMEKRLLATFRQPKNEPKLFMAAMKFSMPLQSAWKINKGELIAQVLFEVRFQVVTVGRHQIPVRVDAPGTVTCSLAPGTTLFESVKITVDTTTLVERMLQETRAVARKSWQAAALDLSRKLRKLSKVSLRHVTSEVQPSKMVDRVRKTPGTTSKSIVQGRESIETSNHYGNLVQEDTLKPEVMRIQTYMNALSIAQAPPPYVHSGAVHCV